MSGGLIFFLSVVLVYVILAVNATVKRVRAWRERRSNARYAKAQTIPREKTTPYRKPLFNLDSLVTYLADREEGASRESPMMSVRINRGSDKFFSWADSERRPKEYGDVLEPMKSRLEPLPPTESELVRSLWRKAGRKPRKK